MVRSILTIKEITKLSDKLHQYKFKNLEKATQIFKCYNQTNIKNNNFSQLISTDLFIKEFDVEDQLIISSTLDDFLTEYPDFDSIDTNLNIKLNQVGSNLKGLEHINAKHSMCITALEYDSITGKLCLLTNHFSHGLDKNYTLFKQCKLGQKASKQNIQELLKDPEFNKWFSKLTPQEKILLIRTEEQWYIGEKGDVKPLYLGEYTYLGQIKSQYSSPITLSHTINLTKPIYQNPFCLNYKRETIGYKPMKIALESTRIEMQSGYAYRYDPTLPYYYDRYKLINPQNVFLPSEDIDYQDFSKSPSDLISDVFKIPMQKLDPYCYKNYLMFGPLDKKQTYLINQYDNKKVISNELTPTEWPVFDL